MNEEIKNPLDIDRIISYMKRTKDEDWCTDVVATKGGDKYCVMGHIFNMGGNFFWEMFESMYATTYMVYPINDGSNKNYPQPTPKERIIAYLQNIKDGKEKTVEQIMEDHDKEREIELKTMMSIGK